MHLLLRFIICRRRQALILATVCRLWGVGLALRGPAGSMRTAVDAMAQYQTWAVRFF
ncbi:unnamed protein product, partial [Phaeothamnion confervicola]